MKSTGGFFGTRVALRYLRRQTTPQQMMDRQTARPTKPTAITAATATYIIIDNLCSYDFVR